MCMRPILAGLGIVLATVTCSPPATVVTGISIALEASPLVGLTGDTVTFIVNVSAASVTDVVINYADGRSDQQHAGGAATARVTFKHVYANGGSYMTRATVTDAAVGNRVVTQLITINPRTDPVSARR